LNIPSNPKQRGVETSISSRLKQFSGQKLEFKYGKNRVIKQSDFSDAIFYGDGEIKKNKVRIKHDES
jgi:hypothetical protein